MTKGNDPLAAAADRTLTTTRVFDAPREVVFRAWTDPKQFAKWFPPDGFTADCELDVRPGGRLRVDMQGADPALGPDFYEKVFPGSALRAPGPGGRVRALGQRPRRGAQAGRPRRVCELPRR